MHQRSVSSPECFVYFSNVTHFLERNKREEQTRLERGGGHGIEYKENHWKFVPPAHCLALPIFMFHLKEPSFVSLFRR